MKYEFSAKGHPNITAAHKTTLEFTKDTELTKKGDCIIGVDSDFELSQLKNFFGSEKVKVTIFAAGIKEELTASPNRSFCSNHELVIRKTGFCSSRTFAINSNKASRELNRKMVESIAAGSPVTILVES